MEHRIEMYPELETGRANYCPDSKVTTEENELNLLRNIIDILMKNASLNTSSEGKVCTFNHPEDLQSRLKGLDIHGTPSTDESILDMCKSIIKYSVKTAHPRFFNQLYGGLDRYGLAGSWISETLNSSMYTYEVAPVFTLMEKHVLDKMLKCVGFEGGDAIMAPGGSISNLYGMNLARYHKFPQVKAKGLSCIKKPLCLFASEKCHYSIRKAAEVLGIGSEHLILVKADDKGKMIPADLEEKIENSISQGDEPFLVVATAGTTVLGAYDPIEEISDICKARDLWLHVDGAWGGSVALSGCYRDLIKGVEKADSMAWNAHKMMGVSQQCCIFLTKHQGLLHHCNCSNAQYLFQSDKHYDVSYDRGDMTLQCGRKNDILKLWMVWKSQGDCGMEKRIEHLFNLSRYLAEQVKQTEGFRLIKEPECTNVCFWYIPPSLRGQKETPEWWAKIGQVAPAIKMKMLQEGTTMITYTPDGDKVNFFRMVNANFRSTKVDMDFVVSEIERIGKTM